MTIKYDILLSFKEYLMENIQSPNTAKTYYAAVVKLFKEVQFNSLEQISSEWILQEAKDKFKTRNEFSAVKNGIKWLARMCPELSIPSEAQFREVSGKKRNFSRRPRKVIYLKPTQRKINQMKNERLKYAFRLAEISGLRVSELADLEANDITLQEGKIFVLVRNGKGGHGGVVECREDNYLYERLPEFLKKYPEGKIFYSEKYMEECAAKLGLECHDLRRIFAIQTRNELKREMPVEEANQIVQQRLRHVRFSTTKRYLFNRKLKFEYDKEESVKEPECFVDENEKTEILDLFIPEKNIEVAKIDLEKYKGISENILTDDVILTPASCRHIQERRGVEFYKKYAIEFKSVITEPDYIYKDDKPNTALVIKKIEEESKYINLVLRLVVQGDNENYKNSIITAIGMGEKRFRRFQKNNEAIYKKE